jgi:hypothetical protein
MKTTTSTTNAFDECDIKRIQWVHSECNPGGKC